MKPSGLLSAIFLIGFLPPALPAIGSASESEGKNLPPGLEPLHPMIVGGKLITAEWENVKPGLSPLQPMVIRGEPLALDAGEIIQEIKTAYALPVTRVILPPAAGRPIGPIPSRPANPISEPESASLEKRPDSGNINAGITPPLPPQERNQFESGEDRIGKMNFAHFPDPAREAGENGKPAAVLPPPAAIPPFPARPPEAVAASVPPAAIREKTPPDPSDAAAISFRTSENSKPAAVRPPPAAIPPFPMRPPEAVAAFAPPAAIRGKTPPDSRDAAAISFRTGENNQPAAVPPFPVRSGEMVAASVPPAAMIPLSPASRAGEGEAAANPPVPPPPARTSPEEDRSRRWLRVPVEFNVEQYPLAKLLGEFATFQGVAAQVSPNLTETVTMKSRFGDPGELLDILSRTQGLNWYFDNSKVYFFGNSELESRLIPLEGRNADILRDTLEELGLFDSRFDWRTAEAGTLLLARGPAVYLDRVAEVLERQTEIREARNQEKVLEIFRLDHAWAEERTISAGGDGDGKQRITVPGVADLLRKILDEESAKPAGSGQAEASGQTPRLRKGTGVVARRNARAEESEAPPMAVSAFIQADPRLNAVLVWDYLENMPRHRAIIESLDQPLPLVEIRAAIIDVETDRTRDLGIAWSLGDQGTWENGLGVNVGTGINGTQITGDGFQYATIYTRGLDQFMSRVSALEKDGSANILSRPSILTQDNIQATLEHTETFYVPLSGYEQVDLADVTTGLTLRVTPHVIDNGRGGVRLAVYIADGNTDSDTQAQVSNLPRVRQSTIVTQAVVYEGEALVIGGYYNEIRRVTDSGVPVLKNIPGLGLLFRNRNNINSKSERLFILSPRIVFPGQAPMRKGTEAERSFTVSPGRDRLAGEARPEDPPARNK